MSRYITIPARLTEAPAPDPLDQARLDTTYLLVETQSPKPTGLVDHRGNQIYSIANPIGFHRS